MRRVHFIEERGWSQLKSRDGGEFDEYDDERTIYFLALDKDGRVGVSMRARPTDDKSILSDIFPQLVEPDAGPVRGSNIWEISRIFATRSNRSRAGLRRRDEVFLATVEAAVADGIQRLVGMIDTYLLPQAQRFPWDLRPLGMPASYTEGEVIGVGISTNRAELERLRDRMSLSGSIIIPAPLGDTGLTPHEIEILLTTAELSEADHAAIAKVVNNLLKSQDHASEEQLLAIIEHAEKRLINRTQIH